MGFVSLQEDSEKNRDALTGLRIDIRRLESETLTANLQSLEMRIITAKERIDAFLKRVDEARLFIMMTQNKAALAAYEKNGEERERTAREISRLREENECLRRMSTNPGQIVTLVERIKYLEYQNQVLQSKLERSANRPAN